MGDLALFGMPWLSPAPSTFWPLTLLQGILLVDLGILAIVLPLMFSIPFAMTIVFMLVASGIDG